ncbi:hypothetical protein ISN44_As11g005350 [Arabidopsis suecica]|uniref:Uncharacterized protein n=1 Tax=Arabidopsis suecica TaxID=45249 RepID=A0A8T1Z5C8_ARASU|nr:hypothetical protein ISN44_As11g005350 [Arabidopsis suecica]
MGSCSLKLIGCFMPEDILFGQHTHNLYISMKRPWKNSGKVSSMQLNISFLCSGSVTFVIHLPITRHLEQVSFGLQGYCLLIEVMLVKHDNDDARDGPDFKTWRTCIHTGHNQCNE